MRFKIVRLTAIRNGLKRILFASGGLGLLRVVSQADIGQCASEDTGPSRGVDCEIPRWLKRGMKHFI